MRSVQCAFTVLFCLNFQVSNIIYLDSPVGVGLSYTKDTRVYESSDLKAAAYTHMFLLEVKII